MDVELWQVVIFPALGLLGLAIRWTANWWDDRKAIRAKAAHEYRIAEIELEAKHRAEAQKREAALATQLEGMQSAFLAELRLHSEARDRERAEAQVREQERYQAHLADLKNANASLISTMENMRRESKRPPPAPAKSSPSSQ